MAPRSSAGASRCSLSPHSTLANLSLDGSNSLLLAISVEGYGFACLTGAAQAAARSATGLPMFQGSKSSMALIGCSPMRVRTSRR